MINDDRMTIPVKLTNLSISEGVQRAVRRPDTRARQTFGIETAHVAEHVHIVGSNLNLMRKRIVFVEREEQFVDGNVEDWNHFLRIGEQLMVERSIDLLHVNAVHVEKRPFDQMDLLELLQIERFRWVDTLEIRFFDTQMKFLHEQDKSTFAFVHVHIRSPDHHLIVGNSHVDFTFLEER